MARINNISDIVINDPINGLTNGTITGTGNGLWSQIQQGSTGPYHAGIDPFEDNFVKLEKKMQALELQYTLLKLKVLGMEGKFTQEEVANIRKMIMSEDESSRTLADSIIDNA
jgi:hypothetical protein